MKMLPILQRKMKSHSNPGSYHVVSLYADGHLECDCIAGEMKGICNHQKLFVKWILNNGKRTKIDNLQAHARIRSSG